MVGDCAALIAAKDLARRIAPTEIPVLIVGETGTGKELLAHYIHRHSQRCGHLVDVDCGALPDDLVESLLFGHKRGAFTGAVNHAKGLLVEADGGSLLLDELANLPLSAQAKLLRVLETGEVRRVGGSTTRSVSFRIIATAQGALGKRVRAGEFRQDLFQRVAGVVIDLPNLAARLSDIPMLADHFASKRGLQLTSDAKEFLTRLDWPGNVRQLKWTVIRGGVFERDGWIDLEALHHAVATGPKPVVGERRATMGVAGPSLAAVCRHHSGDVDRIAEALGVSRSTLYRRLKAEGLSLHRFRRRAEVQ